MILFYDPVSDKSYDTFSDKYCDIVLCVVARFCISMLYSNYFETISVNAD